MLIVYEIECHCGEVATNRTLDTTNPADDGSVHIDVELAVTSTTFDCAACRCTIYTGDLDLMTRPEQCRGAHDDDDDDDDDDEEEVV